MSSRSYEPVSAWCVKAYQPPYAIAEEDGRALAVVRRRPLEDLRDAGPLPVVAVGVDEDAGVALLAELLVDGPAVVVDGVRLRGVRRPEQRGRDAGRAREGQLGLLHLTVDAGVALVGEVDVGEGVDAHLVALLDQVRDDSRVARDHRADQEERRGDVVLLEDRQDLRRPGGVRTVVEGERDRLVRDGDGGGLTAPEGEDRSAVEDLVGDLAGAGPGAHTLVAADLGAQIAVEQHDAGQREQEQSGEDDARFLQRRGLARRPLDPRGGAAAAA